MTFRTELAKSVHYPDLRVQVYAPKPYFTKQIRPDDYSCKIVYSKHEGDKLPYFKPFISDLLNELNARNELPKIDLVVVIPSSQIGLSSATTPGVAKHVANELKTTFDDVVSRIKSTKKLTDCASDEERYEQTRGTLKLTRVLKSSEKNILIIDDVKTSGITLLETAKLLKESGAQQIIAICLGINSNEVD